MAGDYLAAAAFLGLTAIMTASAFDGMIYALGFLVGWPMLLFLIGSFALAVLLLQRPTRWWPPDRVDLGRDTEDPRTLTIHDPPAIVTIPLAFLMTFAVSMATAEHRVPIREAPLNLGGKSGANR